MQKTLAISVKILYNLFVLSIKTVPAHVAEQVDAQDLKSCGH